jgi:glycerol-1-phosphatase
MITGSDTVLATSYDVALLDLDGVVYVGPNAVPAAPAALSRARELGMRLAFVTNNAARTAESVAQHLSDLGIPATADEVITSSQTAAHYLAQRLPAGSKVLVAGTTGLIEALRERGLEPVFSADDDPVAVAQGYSPDADWRMLAEATVAIRRGALWVATNLDATLPSPRGPLPGNGSLVAAVQHATGVAPVAVGKPDPTMHRETVERSRAQHPLVVGDRLDTDIQGARAVGCDSLLVFSGVCTPAEVIAALEDRRPDYLAADVAGLLRPQPSAPVQGGIARCGGWTVTRAGGELTLAGEPVEDDDGYDALRALCAQAWTNAGSNRADKVGETPNVSGTGPAAEAALQRLEL